MLQPADLKPEDLGDLAQIIPGRDPQLRISIPRIPVSETDLQSRVIPVCEPTLGGNEARYVLDCIESNWISSAGKYIPRFEEAFAEACEARYGIACANGTVALHLALATLGVGPGDEVILPTFTMIATINAVTYTGATPVLDDSEPVTWNVDLNQVADSITPRTRVVMPVHTYGHPVGDEIIKKVAGLLEHRSRASDFVGRFGGDEFILILPETYRAGARTLADHLRVALNSLPYVAPDGASIPLRMSFGAASFPEDGQDAASLIAVADANLYESKRWGGDTVTVRSEPVGGEAVDAQAFSTLDALVSAVDNKDHYTRRHSAQVAERSGAVARALGFSTERQEMLRVAALLHDVGKIGVPDRILRKPGALTLDEIEFMNQHSLIGSMMIAQHLPDLTEVREAVVSHHERWDGAGYPGRLRGTEIPLLGRILGVADAYSAMTTDRPYRAALDPREALAELIKGSGTQFDPEIVQVFVSCLSGGAGSAPVSSCLLYTSPSPRDRQKSRMPSSA
jgi:diguanylate cyclase (GGDEF)-like protein/putative nucleotidyltransferase with HDIG domain